jgi:hypothetical protein
VIFRGAYCDTDHCLVVAKVREWLALNKLGHRSLRWKDLISGNLSDLEVGKLSDFDLIQVCSFGELK